MVKIKKGTFILASACESINEAASHYTAINDEYWGFSSVYDAINGRTLDEFVVYDSDGRIVYKSWIQNKYSEKTHRLMTHLELMARYPKSFFNDKGAYLRLLGNWHPGFEPGLYVERN